MQTELPKDYLDKAMVGDETVITAIADALARRARMDSVVLKVSGTLAESVNLKFRENISKKSCNIRKLLIR